jgi:hypothetical protein
MQSRIMSARMSALPVKRFAGRPPTALLRRALVDSKRLNPFAPDMTSRMKAFCAVAALAWTASAHAQLTWEKTEIELRPKPGEEEAVAQFKYTNKGDKPVRITNVKSSCGCTVPALKKNEVAPGESGEITATFKIGGRTGTQVKTVRVDTDDPASPSANLVLKAVIPELVQIQPTFVYWENGEAPKPKTITVRAGKEVPITTLDVSSSSPEFTTKVEKGKAAGEFLVHVQPTDTSRMVSATLTIKSDFPKVFYASARVTGPASAGGR